MKSLQRNILLYYVLEFFRNALLFSAILIPFFKGWGHLNQTEIQTLQSIFMVSVFLFEVPTGAIADFFGRKISLILGQIFFLVGIFVYVSSPNLMFFIMGEMTLAIGSALVSGANHALIYDTLIELNREKEAKKILSNADSFKLAGIMAGSLTGAFLTDFIEVQRIFFLSIIPVSLGIFTTVFLKEPVNKTIKEGEKWIQAIKSGISAIVKDPKMRMFTLDIILIHSISYFVIWLYQPRLIESGIDISFLGVFHAILTIAQIVALQFFSKFERIFKEDKNYLQISIIFIFAGLMSVTFINHWLGVLLFILLTGGIGLSRKVIYIAIINRHIESQKRATVNSVINMFQSFLIACLNPIVGFVADRDLVYSFAFLLFLTIAGFAVSKITLQRFSLH